MDETKKINCKPDPLILYSDSDYKNENDFLDIKQNVNPTFGKSVKNSETSRNFPEGNRTHGPSFQNVDEITDFLTQLGFQNISVYSYDQAGKELKAPRTKVSYSRIPITWLNISDCKYEIDQDEYKALKNHARTVAKKKKNRKEHEFEEIKKLLCLPTDITFPENFIQKQLISSVLKEQNTSQKRQILKELGFGKIESYLKLNKIGWGAYGTVYRARRKLSEGFTLVALKEMPVNAHEKFGIPGVPFFILKEISYLRALKHVNIVNLHDVILECETITLVLDYYPISLDTLIHNYQSTCEQNCEIFMFQILRGLAYCHSQKIIHRDLKPENILLNHKGEVKLIDFSSAIQLYIPGKEMCINNITIWYRPPELLIGYPDYTTSVDMWSLGCVFYEILTSAVLFRGMNQEDMLGTISSALGSPTAETWPVRYEKMLKFVNFNDKSLLYAHTGLDSPRSARHFLKELLKYNPKERMTAEEAKRHSLFDGLGPEVHNLANNASIFSIPSIKFIEEFQSKNEIQRQKQEAYPKAEAESISKVIRRKGRKMDKSRQRYNFQKENSI